MEEKAMIKPNIINGFDFPLSFFTDIPLDEDSFLSLSLLRRFEKGLFTSKKIYITINSLI